MEKIKPKLFSVMKGYTKKQMKKDISAGVTVAIVALPLSIALAVASGVNPERGLYTSIIAGFIISFLGGSRVQIGGPTAAFVIIVYGITTNYGMDGLIIATVMAGFMLVVMGFLKLGNLIKFIPYTINVGFTAGIAVSIFVGQIKDFLGLRMVSVPAEFTEKILAYTKHISTINVSALLVGVVSILIIVFWSKVTDKLPGSLIAIITSTLMVKFLNMDVNTIGSVYGELSSSFPSFAIPQTDFATIKNLISPAFTIAVLAGIVSLFSCVVTDGMIGSKHRSNTELIAQGIGNIASGLFGGLPATGAIARTVENVKNGGRTPISGMVHSITLLLIMLILMPYAALIPMPALAALLIMVAYNMSEWRDFIALIKTSPKSDSIVLLATFFLTVIFDLVFAIEVGIVLAALLFMKRMADVTDIQSWKYLDDSDEETDPESINLREVPAHTSVYEINGPMFFGAADKFMNITNQTNPHVKVVILRMRSVPAMDLTALNSLKKVHKICKKRNVTLLLSHVMPQPLSVIQKSGFYDMIGEENFCTSIDNALARASMICPN